MQDHERPSILAVGLPELFDQADRDSQASADATVANRFASSSSSLESTSLADRSLADQAFADQAFADQALAGGSLAGMTSRISNDTELLQWMIFSAKKHSTANPTVLRSEFGAAGLRMSESIPTCDDSAFGLSLGEAAIPSDAADEVSFIYASSAKRAIELLRIMRFDLLVTSDQLPDMAVSQLVSRVRAVRPWQKWALVMSNETQSGNAVQSEIAARSMGAAAIFDAPGDLGMISDLAHAVSARQPAKMAVGGPAEDVSERTAGRPQATVKTRKSNSTAKRINRAKA